MNRRKILSILLQVVSVLILLFTLLVGMFSLASPALADGNIYKWTELTGEKTGSYVVMDAPQVPAAVATITFQNDLVHNADIRFTLTYEGITVGVYFDYNYNGRPEERLTVTAPEGYVAIPEDILVSEYDIGVIHIYRYIGS